MKRPKLPPDFVRLCQTVTAKRPRTVINDFVEHKPHDSKELRMPSAEIRKRQPWPDN